MNELISGLLYMLSIYLFCDGFISYAYELLGVAYKTKPKHVFICFVVSVIAMQILWNIGFSLFVNWFIFVFVILWLVKHLLKTSNMFAAYIALFSCTLILTLQLIFRALVTMAFNMKLSDIDIDSPITGELKAIILILSYMICYGIFLWCSTERNIIFTRYLIESKKEFRVSIIIIFIMLIYLCTQAYLYQSDSNNITLKLWSILSCVYMLIGYIGASAYAIRYSYLHTLDMQNTGLRQILGDYKDEEIRLQQISDYDEMTEVLNRRAGKQILQELEEKKDYFCLCIVDLDGLKYVNDNFGHHFGDVYLTTVAKLLNESCRIGKDFVFRFGGDEFVMAFVGMPKWEVIQRMSTTYQTLIDKAESMPFDMSISYGMAEYGNGRTLHDIFEIADAEMYEMKNAHRQDNEKFIRA